MNLKTITLSNISNLLLALSSLFIFSCTDHLEEVQVSTQTIPNDIISKLEAAGFYTGNIRVEDNGYVVEGDILMSREYIENLSNIENKPFGPTEEHYVTYNLVEGYKTIKVYMDENEFNPFLVSELGKVLERYNDLELRISFELTTQLLGSDIVFQKSNDPDLDIAKAEFPNNGGPGRNIYLRDIVFNTNFNDAEYAQKVLAHEIGHSIGFRHTDYVDPSACGTEPEGDPYGDGANHVEGTPKGTVDSWMISCVTYNTSFFTTSDEVALQKIYSKFNIEGTVICSSNSYLELQGPPALGVYTKNWEIRKNDGTLVASGNGAVASLNYVNPVSSGFFAEIKYTIIGGITGFNEEVSKEIWIGRPAITKREEELGACYSPWFQYNAPKLEGVTYTWTVNNNNISISGYDDVCFLDANIPDGSTESYMLTVAMTDDETGCSTSISALGLYYQPIFCDCSPASPSCGGNGIPGNQQ